MADQLIIPTPVGNLVVEQKGSLNEYPGVYVSMENGAPWQPSNTPRTGSTALPESRCLRGATR